MKIIEKDFNVTTGKETMTERDETAAETKARLDHDRALSEAKAKAQINAEARAALLTRLGMTAEEAALLLS